MTRKIGILLSSIIILVLVTAPLAGCGKSTKQSTAVSTTTKGKN